MLLYSQQCEFAKLTQEPGGAQVQHVVNREGVPIDLLTCTPQHAGRRGHYVIGVW